MRQYPILLCASLVVIASCKKDADSCVQFRPCYIAEHNGAYTGSTLERIPIPIDYIWGDGCGSKGYLEAEKGGDVTTIRAFATVHECSACYAMPVSFRDTFYFRAPAPGTYYLKLAGRNDVYSMDTIIVR